MADAGGAAEMIETGIGTSTGESGKGGSVADHSTFSLFLDTLDVEPAVVPLILADLS